MEVPSFLREEMVECPKPVSTFTGAFELRGNMSQYKLESTETACNTL